MIRVLGLIPARGGSKGVPRKNALPINGRPLLAYTVDAALEAQSLSRVILSTNDEEIADIGRRCGVEVPFIRPSELAGDDTPMLPVIQHAVHWLEVREQSFDAVCLLQPTNPLRQASDIDACVRLFEELDVDSVITVLRLPVEHHPFWAYLQDESGLLHLITGETDPIPARQQLPQAFHREGSVYVTRREVLMERNSLYGKRIAGYELKPERYVNIDTPADLERAKKLLGASHDQV